MAKTPSQGADSFSRYWTSAMMFEHYKSKGLTGKKLYEAVANATDTTMVQYGRRHRAAYISKLGIVGEAMAPLHTFSTAHSTGLGKVSSRSNALRIISYSAKSS